MYLFVLHILLVVTKQLPIQSENRSLANKGLSNCHPADAHESGNLIVTKNATSEKEVKLKRSLREVCHRQPREIDDRNFGEQRLKYYQEVDMQR